MKKYSKGRGHHCWWLKIHGEAVANFDHECDVNEIVIAGNAHAKLYNALDAISKGEGLPPGETIERILEESRGES